MNLYFRNKWSYIKPNFEVFENSITKSNLFMTIGKIIRKNVLKV